MKKTIFSLIAIGFATASYAQTNKLETTGNVGVGTTSPSALFQVLMNSNNNSGNRAHFGTGTYGISLFNGTNNGFYPRIVMYPQDSNDFSEVGAEILSANDLDATPSVSIGARLTTGAPVVNRSILSVRNHTNELLRVLSNGNVGIGTITPAAKLDLLSTTENLRLSYDATKYASFNAGSGGTLSITRNSVAATTEGVEVFGTNGEVSITSNNNANAALYVRSNGTGNVASFLDGTNTVFTILDGGKVGIGTATPAEALSVNGNIRSKEVKVEETNWPDYVFKSDYKLPTLAEVKAYIDKNKHLPEMPSEQEIVQQGQNLGEINKLLVKKVEELTLHLIMLENRLKQLEKKIIR